MSFDGDLRGLLGQLEMSLARKREALVKLDLYGMAQGTREQFELLQEIRKRNMAELPSGADRAEIKAAAKRILAATRLQAALLARGRGKLRMLANMLAGPGNFYPMPRLQASQAAVLLHPRTREG